jgi:hypothetical protein
VPIVVALLFGVAVLILLCVVVLPLSLIQRYRVGTARRAARGWVITLNLVAIVLSATLFVVSAALANVWVPNALKYTVAGLTGGCVLGAIGIALSRWESSTTALHYTPNRWLVLGVTLIVTTRVLYGFWRSWQAWNAGLGHASEVAMAGVAGSMAAGAVVLGYYLAYWIGVKRRLRHWRQV